MEAERSGQSVSCFVGFKTREEHMHQMSVWSRDPSLALPLPCPATAILLGTDTAVEIQSGIALSR